MRMHRAFISLMVVTACFVYLIVQLMLVQLVRTGHYTARGIDLTARSVYQREHGVVLDDGRGGFVDRFGRPLTNFRIRALAINPATAESWLQEHDAVRQRLLEVTGMSFDEWEDTVSRNAYTQLWKRSGHPMPLDEVQASEILRLSIPGIMVVPYSLRYQQPYYASHLLGYISQDPDRVKRLYADELLEGSVQADARIGASGLELMFEHDLRSRGTISAGMFTDALNRPINGVSGRLLNTNRPFFPLQVVTTLDLDMQMRIEELLDHKQIKDASVVLLDPRTADVLVMTNRPGYDPTRPEPEAANWTNRSVRQQVPGSIFKLVVAAAALEYEVAKPQEHFMCTGEYGKYGFSCWKKGGHGRISFADAFAESCNITFAQIAKRLTFEQIERTALSLGIGRTIGWEGGGSGTGANDAFSQFDQEEPGRIFSGSSDGHDEGALIQSAIGQRDVRMTPLQAANMVVSLLHNGRLTIPRAVSEVRYRDGGIKQRFPMQQATPGISAYSAQKLLQMMQGTVRSGTAASLRDHAWMLAGKTGTAEVGDNRVNEWFVGYGPTSDPQAVASVVIYDSPSSGGNQAVALFEEIMDIVKQVYEERRSGAGLHEITAHNRRVSANP